MVNHIVILIHLNATLLSLNRVDSQIQEARKASMDQAFQEALDLHQARVNRRRDEVRIEMANIRNRN